VLILAPLAGTDFQKGLTNNDNEKLTIKIVCASPETVAHGESQLSDV
jgi:hypothetical protein